MKRLLSIAGCCFALAPWAPAQVGVELLLDQDHFLPGESVPVGVRIVNHSGQTLHFGADDHWLDFSIEGRDGHALPAEAVLAVQGLFDVPASTAATRRIDLAPGFNLSRPGVYWVTATVRVAGWDQALVSKRKSFDVIAGTTLWEADVGVPRPDGKPPEIRKYALQQAIHLKNMKLYVRVTDPSGARVIRVFPIGPLISFSRPERQIDRSSNLHVLYQTGARSFNYSVINPDGLLLVRQTYDYTDTRPVLRVDGDGRIHVGGGARRASADDLPTPMLSPPVNDADQP